MPRHSPRHSNTVLVSRCLETARKDLETVLGLGLGRGGRAHRKGETGETGRAYEYKAVIALALVAAWLCCAVDFHLPSIQSHTGRGGRVIASCSAVRNF
ncbi:hypothetical protein CI102_6613 [Trichoderma harzianum]|nr:hypothetical protein CI102_6613 [Trichoderma harzianum]